MSASGSTTPPSTRRRWDTSRHLKRQSWRIRRRSLNSPVERGRPDTGSGETVATEELTLTAKHGRPVERAIRIALFGCAAVSVLVTAGIIYSLFTDTIRFFQEVDAIGYLTGTTWSPQSGSYGVLELVYGTLIITLGSMLIAGPLGIATAVYLSEYAPARVRRVVKPVLELLAGIPTVVFGYFALNFVTPEVMRRINEGCGIFNWGSASIVVGLFILPTVASLSEDAMR